MMEENAQGGKRVGPSQSQRCAWARSCYISEDIRERTVFSRLFEILWGPEPVIMVQRLFGDQLGWLFHGLTLLGASPGMVIIVAVAFWLRGHRLALRLSGILLLTVTTNMLFWQIVGVPRPDDPGIVQRATVSVTSFPSGHTGSATAMWGLLASWHYVPTVLSILVVVGVMVSRLYLGVHYLGDVIGGLVVGFVALAIYRRWHYLILHWLITIVRSVQRRLGKWAFPVALAVGPVGFLIALFMLGTNQKGWQIGGAI
ncbi:MAG: hypothetical protein AVDCRST_MAG93-3102, partial [uncultured Chloroflexia bacterium]